MKTETKRNNDNKNNQCGRRDRPTWYAPDCLQPSHLTVWPDLETGTLVAFKVGNIPSKFGHARPMRSGIIRYVRYGQTYRQTEG